MFNTTTSTYTLQDAAGSYSWLTEGLDPAEYADFTDGQLAEWVKTYVEIEIERDIADAEEAARELSFPRFGYSTTQVFEDKDEYLDFKREEIRSEVEADAENAIAYLRTWASE